MALEELRRRHAGGHDRELDIAVIRYPRISNFTDFDPLGWEPDTAVRYVSAADELGTPDVVILPGTKDTISDLQFLRDRGLDQAILHQVRERGTQLVGICGGYQMLGEQLLDPHAVEGSTREASGLGLLPLTTTFLQHKRTVRASGHLADHHPLRLHLPDEEHVLPLEAYEIHMGITRYLDEGSFLQIFISHRGSLRHFVIP